MSKVKIDCRALKAKERKMLEGALSEAVSSDMPLVFELVFVSEDEIRELNGRIRNVDKVTDVLSFPAMDLTAGEDVIAAEHADCIDGKRLFLGSVAICKERARQQAEEYGHSYEREIGYLAVHGFLHCLGYDHEAEEEKRAMRAREEEIMETLGLGREE